MSGLVGGLWNWNAGLVERKANFKKIVNRMGRWPGYGGSAVTMGEWPAYEDLPRCMGRCVRRVVVWGNRDTVWGGGPCVGRPRNRMGNESRMKNRNMEAGGGGSAWWPPDRMGSLSQWQTWRDLRALRIFATTGSAARVWAPPDWTALLVHCSIFGGFHSFQALVNSGDLCRSLFKSVF